MGNLVQEAPRAKYQRNDRFLLGLQRGLWRGGQNGKSGPGGAQGEISTK